MIYESYNIYDNASCYPDKVEMQHYRVEHMQPCFNCFNLFRFNKQIVAMTSSLSSTQLLSPHVRQTITNISQRFFNQDSSYGQIKDQLPGNEIATSLPLQMSMFFNICFFPFWLTADALMLSIKYDYLDDTYKVLLIAILVIFSFVEMIRLYLGYVGNLQEKVPELAGFLLLTVIPQLPLLLFLLFNDNAIILPLERAVNIVLILLVLVQIIAGWFAARMMSRQQATKFHLRQFIDLEHLPGNNAHGDPNAPQLLQRNTYRA